jgi:gamma-glutamylcyclotransferase (GGCT)/AIG2-like uncharacterized protein YtfP
VSRRLFVYGSLRRQSVQPMALELRSAARWLGEARLQGRLFDLGQFGAVVAGAGTVYGELFEGVSADLLLRLDRYEGEQYRRRLGPVAFGAQSLAAWCYWYLGPLDGARELLSGRYPFAPGR